MVSFVRSSIKLAKSSDLQFFEACLSRKQQSGHLSLLAEEIRLREKKSDDYVLLGKRKRDQTRRERIEILLKEVSIVFKTTRGDEKDGYEEWFEDVTSKLNGLAE